MEPIKRETFFALVGESCVCFESLCDEMSRAIDHVLRRSGLDGVFGYNFSLRNIILDSKTAKQQNSRTITENV